MLANPRGGGETRRGVWVRGRREFFIARSSSGDRRARTRREGAAKQLRAGPGGAHLRWCAAREGGAWASQSLMGDHIFATLLFSYTFRLCLEHTRSPSQISNVESIAVASPGCEAPAPFRNARAIHRPSTPPQAESWMESGVASTILENLDPLRFTVTTTCSRAPSSAPDAQPTAWGWVLKAHC